MTDIVDDGTKGSGPPRTRDIGPASAPKPRKHIVAIGIDQYRSWTRLHNAVNDARGALAAFQAHGFEEFRTLFDDAATHQALQTLVADDLQALGSEDSLVLFFAGHGHTVSRKFDDGRETKQGYLIPFDAQPQGGKTTTWLNLKGWLDDITKLPVRHILVILDACHSGVALDAVFRWRSAAPILREPLTELRKRRSRRILASALDHQRALDGGPHAGHSLFTGCLIEGLAGRIPLQPGQTAITGADIGLYVQHRVSSFPSTENQTPDFGALDLDQNGQLVIDLTPTKPPRGAQTIILRPSRAGTPSLTSTSSATGSKSIILKPASKPAPEPVKPVVEDAVPAPGEPSAEEKPAPTQIPIPGWPWSPSVIGLDASFVAKLEQHHKARHRDGVLSVIAADASTSLTGWAKWSASHGWLTLVSEEIELGALIGDLLDQMPWMRMLPAARAYFAAAARMDERAVDAALNKRRSAERDAWIQDMVGRERQARIAGWLLTTYRELWASGPDLAIAPAQNMDLLAAIATLSAPISILLHHPAPSASWLEQAIQTAVQLTTYLPRHAVAVAAPEELLRKVIRDHQHTAAFMAAKKGMVPLGAIAPLVAQAEKPAHQLLQDALAARPTTTDLFVSNFSVTPSGSEHPVIVDLYAREAELAIQIDDWYHARDRLSYRQERQSDRWLQQRSGIVVARFLAEDVHYRLERVVEEIALGVATRRATDSSVEKSS